MEPKLVKIFTKLAPSINENDYLDIEQNKNLIEKGYIDSITLVELATLLEEEYNIELMPEDMILENFDTLSSILNLVNKRKEN